MFPDPRGQPGDVAFAMVRRFDRNMAVAVGECDEIAFRIDHDLLDLARTLFEQAAKQVRLSAARIALHQQAGRQKLLQVDRDGVALPVDAHINAHRHCARAWQAREPSRKLAHRRPAIDRKAVTSVHQLLHDRFGFSHFRGVQEDVVERAVSGRHTLAVMPTGAGKSLCYQLPALTRHGTAIVISPLIALMQDQVRSAESFGIHAAALTSASEDPRAIRDALRDGRLDLLYVAPERATTESFGRLLQEVDLALFAIDEAHCVSEWGHDFRPDYLLLLPLLDQHREVPRLALTATADRRTRADILVQLGIAEEGLIVAGFDRPNIRYQIGRAS